MLHELLIALNGCPGSIFVEDSAGNIKVVPNLPFIHPTETELLNRLCKLGSLYRKFQQFIRKHGHHPVPLTTPGTIDSADKVGQITDGLYVKAFANGLDMILDGYRESLIEVEQDILADPHLPASYLQSKLEYFQSLFPAVNNMIEALQVCQAHGCYLLEVIHSSSNSGIPSVKHQLHKILKVCHCVMYKQISAWMLHGMLLDTHHEFFIHKTKSPNKTVPTSQEDDDDLGLAGVTAKQLQKVMQLNENDSDMVASYERFALRPDMLPSYIPPRVANKILFVGESVQMFKNDSRITLKQSDSILKNKENNFAKQFHRLSEMEEFSLMTFEEIVDEIRACVAERLWKLVVEESDVFAELRILKDFYLLGRGELFLAFIDCAKKLLNQPPSVTTQHDVHSAFQQAARSVMQEDENLFQKLQIVIEGGSATKVPSTKTKSDKKSIDRGESAWNFTKLIYTVDWPLHILFTNQCLDRYNKLWRFLLLVKRIQLDLQNLWAGQMYKKQEKLTAFDRDKWHVRTHMAFLVDNLQYYLQVDVIESQYSILVDKINNTRDFEAIRLAHDYFLTSLMSQSFLLMKPVHQCLTEILEGCHSFCVLVNSIDGAPDQQESDRLKTITENFRLQSGLLFKILSSVRSHQSSPHLAQLLLRIDFNKYFTQAGGQLGGTVVAEVPASYHFPSSSRR